MLNILPWSVHTAEISAEIPRAVELIAERA